eukprot:7777235-Lingulodinium_polyedra.AAC.1
MCIRDRTGTVLVRQVRGAPQGWSAGRQGKQSRKPPCGLRGWAAGRPASAGPQQGFRGQEEEGVEGPGVRVKPVGSHGGRPSGAS